MKYIDAKKLKKIVEQAKQRALKGAEVDEDMYCDGRAYAFEEVLLEIDSLQQEQPEVDLEKEIKHMVECEAEYMIFQDKRQLISYMARHFYELGFNARKEE